MDVNQLVYYIVDELLMLNLKKTRPLTFTARFVSV